MMFILYQFIFLPKLFVKIFVSFADLSVELKHVHVEPIFELSKEIS